MPQTTDSIEQKVDYNSIEPMLLYMGRLAREGALALARASMEQKNAALEACRIPSAR